MFDNAAGLEVKFCRFDSELVVGQDGMVIEGYASRFGACDQGGDIVETGAYGACLKMLADQQRKVRMLWQHDPAQPIGVWEEIREDATGLWVKGRLLDDVARGREAAALIRAGAIDGLSIGYRTKRAGKDASGRRLLTELELWEVSLVTFPMLPSARIASKGDSYFDAELRNLAAALREARATMAAR